MNVTYFNATHIEKISFYTLGISAEELLSYFNNNPAEITLTFKNPVDQKISVNLIFQVGWYGDILFNETFHFLPKETKKIALPLIISQLTDAPVSFRLRIRSYDDLGKLPDQNDTRSPIISVDNYRISLIEELNEGDMWLADDYGKDEIISLGAALDDVTQKNKKLIFEIYDNLCKKNGLENRYEHLRYEELGSRVDLSACLLSTEYGKTCVRKVTSADDRFYVCVVTENSGKTASPPISFNFTGLGNVTLENLSVYDPIRREYVAADPLGGFIVYPIMNSRAAFEYDYYEGGIYTPRYKTFLLEFSAPEGRHEFEFKAGKIVIRRSFELENLWG